jgi:hypothetical protein
LPVSGGALGGFEEHGRTLEQLACDVLSGGDAFLQM